MKYNKAIQNQENLLFYMIGEDTPSQEFTPQVLDKIDRLVRQEEIKSIYLLGGEPFNDNNLFLTYILVDHFKKLFPDVKFYIWSTYTYKTLLNKNPKIDFILDNVDDIYHNETKE